MNNYYAGKRVGLWSTFMNELSTTVFVDVFVRDFGKLNARGNVCKIISVSLASYRQIGSKSTNQSSLVWRQEGLKGTLLAVMSMGSVDSTQD